MLSYCYQLQLILAFIVIILQLIFPITSLTNLSTPNDSVQNYLEVDVTLEEMNSSVSPYTFSTYFDYATKLVDKRNRLAGFIDCLKPEEYIRLMFVTGISLISTQKAFANNSDYPMSRYMLATHPHAIVFTQNNQSAATATRLSFDHSTADTKSCHVTDTAAINVSPYFNYIVRQPSMWATQSNIQGKITAKTAGYNLRASKVRSAAGYVLNKSLADQGTSLHNAHHILKTARPNIVDSNRGQLHIDQHTLTQTALPVSSTHIINGIDGVGQAFFTEDNTITTQPALYPKLGSNLDYAETKIVTNTDNTTPSYLRNVECLTTVPLSDAEHDILCNSILTDDSTAKYHYDEANGIPLTVSDINAINTVTPTRQTSTQAMTTAQWTDTNTTQVLIDALPDQYLSQTEDPVQIAVPLQAPVQRHALTVVEEEVGHDLVAVTATTNAWPHNMNDLLEIRQPYCDVSGAQLQTEGQAHNIAIDAKTASLLKSSAIEITSDHLIPAYIASNLHPDAADQLNQHREADYQLSVINPIKTYKLSREQLNPLADDRYQSNDVIKYSAAINKARGLIPGGGNAEQLEAIHALLNNVRISAAVQAGQELSCDEINTVIAFPMSLKTRIINSIAAIRAFNHNQAATIEQMMDHYTLVTHLNDIVPSFDEYQMYSQAQSYSKANVLEIIVTVRKIKSTHNRALLEELIAYH